MRLTITSLFFLLALVFTRNVAAQDQGPSMEELQQRMLELQRRMMQQLQNSPFNSPGFTMPQGDTTFYFRFDTTFEGGNMSHFFHFSPFGGDSTLRGSFRGFDHFFDPFFGPERFFNDPGTEQDPFPADDGNQSGPDDGLLPEERLRRQKESEKPANGGARVKPAEPRPDPKIKTIRI